VKTGIPSGPRVGMSQVVTIDAVVLLRVGDRLYSGYGWSLEIIDGETYTG